MDGHELRRFRLDLYQNGSTHAFKLPAVHVEQSVTPFVLSIGYIKIDVVRVTSDPYFYFLAMRNLVIIEIP